MLSRRAVRGCWSRLPRWLASVVAVAYLTPDPGAPAPTRTALIAPVPAVEPVVAEHRRHLDAASTWGIAAHVSVLYPFVPPSAVDDHVIATVARALAAVPAFDCSFARCRWFGQDVLWLEPDPAQPLRDLTAAVWTAFPAYPPYGGVHDEVVPHLTVADRPLGDLRALQAAEDAVQARLPVAARIDHVLLVAGTDASSSWAMLHRFDLATSALEAGTSTT